MKKKKKLLNKKHDLLEAWSHSETHIREGIFSLVSCLRPLRKLKEENEKYENQVVKILRKLDEMDEKLQSMIIDISWTE